MYLTYDYPSQFKLAVINMSDKQLKDIGITRGEIKQRFYGTDSET